jgi:uncharacterized damage-inducible protein DinB
MSSTPTITDPRYPIGRFHYEEPQSQEDRAQKRKEYIDALATLPRTFRNAVKDLTEAQLDTPYREGGWTVRQLIHHIPDSHMNAYVRFKMALTETDPVIKTYEEQLWAELEDSRETPVEISLTLLEALHTRWVVLLRTLKDEAFSRCYVHPQMGPVALDKALALYAWHGAHHTAHVTELRKRIEASK